MSEYSDRVANEDLIAIIAGEAIHLSGLGSLQAVYFTDLRYSNGTFEGREPSPNVEFILGTTIHQQSYFLIQNRALPKIGDKEVEIYDPSDRSRLCPLVPLSGGQLMRLFLQGEPLDLSQL